MFHLNSFSFPFFLKNRLVSVSAVVGGLFCNRRAERMSTAQEKLVKKMSKRSKLGWVSTSSWVASLAPDLRNLKPIETELEKLRVLVFSAAYLITHHRRRHHRIIIAGAMSP